MLRKLDIPDDLHAKKRPFHTKKELLLGAGPSNCSVRVLQALVTAPILIPGYKVYEIMSEFKELLKYVFQTKNDATLAIQTSGTGGLEAALVNVVGPKEKILVAVNGFWGKRLAEMARIRGIEVEEIVPNSSMVFELNELETAIARYRPALLFITHGDSSTGVVQNLKGLGEICHKYDCLLFIDAVISLGAIPLHVDRWNIDIAVSASQKAARSLPGLAYLTFSAKAVNRIRSIKSPPPFYYDVLSLCSVWKCFEEHSMYHYTYNSVLLSASKEGLAEIREEGLLETWKRHEEIGKRLWSGLEKLGLSFFVKNSEHRLYPITCVYLPEGVKWENLSTYLIERYDMHLSIGIGPCSPQCFRIGIMGCNANVHIVDYLLDKLEEALKHLENK